MHVPKINPSISLYPLRHFELPQNTSNRPCNVDKITELPSYNLVDKSLVRFTSASILDDYIGGYENEKMNIDMYLLTPVNERLDLYPSLLLTFPDETSKRSILNGLKNKLNACIFEVSGSDPNMIHTIKRHKLFASARYLQSKIPTVLFINDAEKAIGMSPAYARTQAILPMKDEDIDIIRINGASEKNLNFFKTFLDNDMDGNKDLTIVFVSNYPQYIHPDLMSRDGKMKKVIFPFVRFDELKDSAVFESKRFINDGVEFGVTDVKNQSVSSKIEQLNKDNINFQTDELLSSIVKKHLNKSNLTFLTVEDLFKIAGVSYFDAYRFKNPRINYSDLFDYNMTKFQKSPTNWDIKYKNMEILLEDY